MRNRFIRGSITVEASFLIPFLLYIIICLVCSVFYIYNRNILSDASLLGALYATYLEDLDDSTLCTEVTRKCTEAVGERLVGAKEITVTVCRDRSVITVMLAADYGILPISWRDGFFGRGEIRAEATANRLRPAELLRRQ